MKSLVGICISVRFVGLKIVYTFAPSFRFWGDEFTIFTYS